VFRRRTCVPSRRLPGWATETETETVRSPKRRWNERARPPENTGAPARSRSPSTTPRSTSSPHQRDLPPQNHSATPADPSSSSRASGLTGAIQARSHQPIDDVTRAVRVHFHPSRAAATAATNCFKGLPRASRRIACAPLPASTTCPRDSADVNASVTEKQQSRAMDATARRPLGQRSRA
jgi:hypothetical protein